MGQKKSDISDYDKKTNSSATDIFDNANHSRWMTDIWEEIADLSIANLVLPSTHNAGADQEQLWGLEELLAACQDDTFGFQLERGARVFDLRLEDFSYSKWQGLNVVVHEKVGFEHMLYTGRLLRDCVATIRAFAISNPKELIILSIESYKSGRMANYIDRCQQLLAPLDGLLIPQSSAHMTLRQLSQSHPNRNVIIAAPENLRTGNHWTNIFKKWAGDDATLDNLNIFTDETLNKMTAIAEPVPDRLWLFNAHARNSSGPMRPHMMRNYFDRLLNPTSKMSLVANIINVDFFQETGLVDYCIKTNKERGIHYPLAPAPTALTAAQIELTEAVHLKWTPPLNAKIRYYEVSINGAVAYTTYYNSLTLPTVQFGTHTYKVCAVDNLRRRTAFTPDFTLVVKDISPPSTPGRLRFSNIGLKTVKLEWTASQDASGIKRYEVKRDGGLVGYVQTLESLQANLAPELPYQFSVRAEDNVGLWSNTASITLPARPASPISPSFTINELNWSADKHKGVLKWEETFAADHDYDYQVKLLPNTISYIGKTVLSQLMLVNEGAVNTIEIRARIRGTEEMSSPLTYTFTVDSEAPGKVTNLRATIIDDTSATLTWSPASGAVRGYAVQVNDDVPIYVPASPCSHTLRNLKTSASNKFEVWAINGCGVPGEPATS